jgi:adenine-specific DNA-methyltransferase
MTLNYIGSKKSLIDFIDIPLAKIIEKSIDQTKSQELIFLDGFAGTGIVGSSVANKYNNVRVIANDLEYYSFIINYSLLCVPYTEKLEQIIIEINNIIQNPKKRKFEPAYNLITQNYTLKGADKRMFWTEENSSAGDYTRFLIDKILKQGKINSSEHIYLIGSLLYSMDKIANTASVYSTFLKKFRLNELF